MSPVTRIRALLHLFPVISTLPTAYLPLSITIYSLFLHLPSLRHIDVSKFVRFFVKPIPMQELASSLLHCYPDWYLMGGVGTSWC